jgi:hypothetical protein
MTLKAYIWGMRVITFFLLIALGIVINYIDPTESWPVGVALFYLIVFFALAGIFNLFLFAIRKKLLGNELAAESVGLNFRQGILLSLIILGIMILQNLEMLVWWDALLVVAGVFLIELYFLSKS